LYAEISSTVITADKRTRLERRVSRPRRIIKCDRYDWFQD
jgi:hypothetical protein